MLKSTLVKELLLCGKNCAHFINKYVRVEHPIRGVIPMHLYDYQEAIVNDFLSHRFNIINKARQMGLSTTVAAYITWMIMFHQNKNVLVVATKIDVAKNIIDKVKIIMKNLPKDLFIAKPITDNMHSIVMSNGSRVKASTTSKDVGRSEALTLLVCDESAHIDNMEELWTGLYPTLSRGGRCILISTPHGTGNFFHKTYVDAEANVNEFKARTITWRNHPEQDDAWFAKVTRNMSAQKIAQEYEASFIASGNTVIQPEDIAYLSAGIKDPIERIGIDRNIWIWEHAIPNEQYILAADIARGDGSDYSTFHCLRVSTWEVVAEYKGKLPPEVFGIMLDHVGRMYNDALVAPENNSFGYSVILKLKELSYPNLYVEGKRRNVFIGTSLEVLTEDDNLPGFNSNMNTKPLILAKLEEVIRNKTLRCYSTRFVEELKTFRWLNGKAMAEKKYNDDLVISLAICVWLSDTTYAVNERARDINTAMLNAIGRDERSWKDAKNTGNDVASIYNPQSSIHGYQRKMNKIKTVKGEEIDMSWVISSG